MLCSRRVSDVASPLKGFYHELGEDAGTLSTTYLSSDGWLPGAGMVTSDRGAPGRTPTRRGKIRQQG